MHTKEQEITIKEYIDSVDNDVISFIKDVLNGNNETSYITVAFLSDEASKQIYELTNKNVTGNRVVLDINAIKHILNRHGEFGKQDSSMSNLEDIARIGYILTNYDEINYKGVSTTGYLDENGNPAPMIQFSKRIDGKYYVIEAVNSSKKKKNYIITAYISKA